jgi:uncharacterized protein (DUF2147 family)/peroxiredoxin
MLRSIRSLWGRAALTCLIGLIGLSFMGTLRPAQAGAPPSPTDPRGRWITASGNLEVEIASCGKALCGTVTKVLANRSMGGDGREMQPVDTRPALGMKLLLDMAPDEGSEALAAQAEWQGRIYNRENGQTYRCSMSVSTATQPEGELVLRAYIGIPLFGKTQRWQRVPVVSPAPEFSGIGQWFNTAPLRMAQLRGKVVLVDFWTQGCANCIPTLPHVQGWHQRYQGQGLVVVGVHTPEYPAEGEPASVQAAITRWGITYPVALDQDHATWSAWRNAFWPALYLIDRQGRVVFQHVGEGGYAQIEAQIQLALQQRP